MYKSQSSQIIHFLALLHLQLNPSGKFVRAFNRILLQRDAIISYCLSVQFLTFWLYNLTISARSGEEFSF